MATKMLIIHNVEQDRSRNVTDIKYELLYEAKSNKNSSDYVKGTYTPKAGDKLFFTKDCTVPRFKVKSLCEKHKISITRDRTKADAVFISERFLDVYIDTNWVYHCSTNAFEVHLKKTPYAYNVKVMEMLKFIKENNIDKICIEYRVKNSFDINGFELETSSDHIRFCTQENFDILRDLFTSKNTHIQDDILKILNEGVIIDKEMYKQIGTMIESSDNSNIKMAMEIMANSDYEKSAPYILLLFKNYGYSLWDSGFRNHVNFKSLVEFFDLSGRRGYNQLDLDEIVDKLKNKNLLTEENIAIFMPLAYDEIKQRASYDHFKVSKIDFIENPEEENDEEILNIEDEDPAF